MNEHPTGDESSPRSCSDVSEQRGSSQRLTKRDVETLLATYDDDPVAALTRCLLTLHASADLIASLATMSENDRDQMVKDLVEWRGLSR